MAERVKALRLHLCASVPSLPNSRPSDAEQPVDVEQPVYLRGNFAPTQSEGHWGNLKLLEGEVPDDLRGMFVRIGPNPRFDFKGLDWHPFDGDGLIHAITFDRSVASYTKRYVETRRLQHNVAQGFDVADFAETIRGKRIKGRWILDAHRERMGRANTNCVVHGGQLLALEENDKPYALRMSFDGEKNLRTLGRVDFAGGLRHNCSAHPKVCPCTGELIAFCYSLLDKKNALQYTVVDKAGKVTTSFSIPLEHTVMVHDCVVTRNHTLILNTEHRFELARAVEGRNPFKHHQELPSSFAVFPRNAESAEEVIWIKVEGCSVFHFANAWEDRESGLITVLGCRSATVTMAREEERLSGEREPDFHETAAYLYVWRLDPVRGICVEERRLSDIAIDFPQIDQNRMGLPSSYVYATKLLQGRRVLMQQGVANPDGANMKLPEVVKFDVATALKGGGMAPVERFAFHNYGRPHSQAWGTETVFAPRHGRAAGSSAWEVGDGDNGYLISFSHDEYTGQSECQVVDAKSMSLKARIAMPAAVPYGFHAWWCLGEDIAE